MSYNTLIVEHRGRVSWLFLNRPDALNAISIECMKELRRALEELRDREETRVIVFSGKGRGFCAGADLTGAAVLKEKPSPDKTFLDYALEMETVLDNMPKPIIAAVNGVCCGGGLELALMCDFIVAVETAKIGDAHANFGAMPGGGATARLPRMVGAGTARYMMYTGDLFLAPEMAAAGLVAKLFKADEFEGGVQALAEKIASKSPLGLRRMKQLIADGQDQPLALAIKTEKLVSAEHMRSYDASEGGKAFGEKRKPEFRGY